MGNRIAVIGSSGAIGNALTVQLAQLHPDGVVYAIARQPVRFPQGNIAPYLLKPLNEEGIAAASKAVTEEGLLDLVIVATGLLHEGVTQPEKSLRDLSPQKFMRLFEVNTILPAIVAKHFIPKLRSDGRAIFAALSARVGSISDNHLGGWYAYRASKAALNMIIRNAALETSRRRDNVIVVGLHPGTVDSKLSQPFQSAVPKSKLFSPNSSATSLIAVLNELTANDSGHCFAWDGSRINP
ncbi:MAG: SDR family NAD(P)-dependent oxidoreductase [Rhodobacteraceae bacterium]|nr:SDR family NAD(P)-dependent oxidoreductase [Paracoccaceae bacterium]MCY4197553.1 SDR family NAD(P)-dependent oxidoreductase [Paracoccaceae bacterium]MCY4326585.1 SDR family NAD(P)-dependent oxidoreductase [Paracoccaceae bacterium]